jgi:lipoprotein
MKKIHGFILAIVMFFSCFISMDAQLMPQSNVIPYEQIGYVRLDTRSINSSYNLCYYTIQTKHVFVIEAYGEKIDFDDNVIVLFFDDGSISKLHQDEATFDSYYNSLYKRYTDVTRLFYALDDETIDMLKYKNLVNMRIDFGNSRYKDLSLVDRGEKIKAWFNKCYDKATQIIEKRSNDLY